MFWVMVAIAAVLVFIGALVDQAKKGGKIGFPYVPARTLFSAAERSFLGVLDQAVGPEHRVFGKVRIADVALVKSSTRSARQAAINRISGKHLDFVVCRASDLAIVCAVELNDRSHDGKKAQVRDAFVADVCRTIGLPLLVLPARARYVVEDVRQAFVEAIAPVPAP
jgi:hypothetical protein